MAGLSVGVSCPAARRLAVRARGIGVGARPTLVRAGVRMGTLALAEIRKGVHPHVAARCRATVQETSDGVRVRVTCDHPAAVFLERGTRPHLITAVNALALRWYVGGQAWFAKWVRHPGTKALRFFRDGLARIRPVLVRSAAASLGQLTRGWGR